MNDTLHTLRSSTRTFIYKEDSTWHTIDLAFGRPLDHTQRPPVGEQLPLGECRVWADVLTSNLK